MQTAIIALEFRRVKFDVQLLASAYHASRRPFAESAMADYGE
jgi:hypothetical protein